MTCELPVQHYYLNLKTNIQVLQTKKYTINIGNILILNAKTYYYMIIEMLF